MSLPTSPGVAAIVEFHDYCRRGNLSAISEMATPELVNEHATLGYTALHWAAQCGQAEAVKLLLSLGSNVNAVCDMGETALHLASERDFVDCAKALVKGNINTDISCKNGVDAYQRAKSEGMRNAIKKIDLNDTSSFIVQQQEDSDSE